MSNNRHNTRAGCGGVRGDSMSGAAAGHGGGSALLATEDLGAAQLDSLAATLGRARVPWVLVATAETGAGDDG